MIDVRYEKFGRVTNGHFVHLGPTAIAFSYATPIGVFLPGQGWVARENAWGPTTGRHITALIGPRADRVPADEFETLLARALVLAGEAATPFASAPDPAPTGRPIIRGNLPVGAVVVVKDDDGSHYTGTVSWVGLVDDQGGFPFWLEGREGCFDSDRLVAVYTDTAGSPR